MSVPPSRHDEEVAQGTLELDGLDVVDAGPSRLSPSSAETFRTCPRRWKYRYVDKLPETVGPEAVVGSFTHRVLEELLDQPPDQRTMARARELAGLLWAEFAEVEDVQALRLTDRRQSDLKWKVWRAVEGYFELEDPESVDVVQREQRLEAVIDGVPFVGVVDRTDKQRDGRVVITDYKTGRPPRADWESDRLLQVLFYAAALQRLGWQPARARLMYLGGRVVEIDTTESTLGGAVARLREVWDGVNAAVAAEEFPAQPGALCCYCSFVDRCAEGAAEMQQRWGSPA